MSNADAVDVGGEKNRESTHTKGMSNNGWKDDWDVRGSDVRRRTHSSLSTDSTEEHALYWLPEDARKRDEHLRRLLRGKRDSINNHIGMFCSPYDPGLGPMLCLDRHEVHGRIHKLVSGIKMVYGLVLSGVAKSALDPFDVEKDFAEDPFKRNLANFYNLAATVQFVLCLCGSLFSTIVFIVLSYQPDSTIYRIASQFDFFLAYCYMIFYSTFLLLAQVAAVIFIRSDPTWAWVILGLIILIFVTLFNHFAYGFKKAFPNFAVHVFPIFAMASFNPFVWRWMFSSQEKEAHQLMMKHTADTMIQDAENNFGKDVVNKVRSDVAREEGYPVVGMPPTHGSGDKEANANEDGVIFGLSTERGQQLQALLSSALPHTVPERRYQLAIGMLIEEMDVPSLVSAAKSSMVVLGISFCLCLQLRLCPSAAAMCASPCSCCTESHAPYECSCSSVRALLRFPCSSFELCFLLSSLAARTLLHLCRPHDASATPYDCSGDVQTQHCGTTTCGCNSPRASGLASSAL